MEKVNESELSYSPLREKVRVSLSVGLLEAILEEAPKALSTHELEINKIIGSCLFKLAKGVSKPSYKQRPKTLEELVALGQATPEQELAYNKLLMESL